MNTQHKKVSRIARTLFVLVFTLLTSVTLVDGQGRKPKAKTPRQPDVRIGSQFSSAAFVPTKLPLTELVRRVKPSVVALYVFDKDGKLLKQGSAFFIAPRRVATNFHVIEGGSAGDIHTSQGAAYTVSKILSSDKNADLAILEVELPTGVEFKPLTIARGAVQEGEEIVVIGSPLGLEGTISQGIVSALRESVIQISAPISHGSSGGPVLNMRGEVVGVAAGGRDDGQNLNYALTGASLAVMSERAEQKSKITRLYEDGVRFYKGGNYKSALEMLERTIKSDPTYAAAWLQGGLTLFKLGNYADAVAAFIETARLEPGNADAHYGAGAAYTHLGRDGDAITCFRRVLSIVPNSAETYVEIGNAYYRLSNFQNAVDSYKQAINLLPGNATAQYYLGVALIAQGERKAARKQVKKLRELGANEFANELLQKIP